MRVNISLASSHKTPNSNSKLKCCPLGWRSTSFKDIWKLQESKEFTMLVICWQSVTMSLLRAYWGLMSIRLLEGTSLLAFHRNTLNSKIFSNYFRNVHLVKNNTRSKHRWQGKMKRSQKRACLQSLNFLHCLPAVPQALFPVSPNRTELYWRELGVRREAQSAKASSADVAGQEAETRWAGARNWHSLAKPSSPQFCGSNDRGSL